MSFDLWRTPRPLFDLASQQWGPFDLDAAAGPDDHLCEQWLDDGLRVRWAGRVWVNPPYSRGLKRWVEKAAIESGKGALVCLLLPCDVSTEWWALVVAYAAEICELTSRVRFWHPDRPQAKGPTFGACFVVFDQTRRNRQGMAVRTRLDVPREV